MFSMLRATLFRFVKTPVAWAAIIAGIVCVASVPVIFSFLTGSGIPGANPANGSVAPTPEALWGSALAATNGLPLFVCVTIGTLVAADFKTGAVKNVLQARGGRTSYALAVMVGCVAVSLVFTVLGIAAVEICWRIMGVAATGYDIGHGTLWALQLALIASAYAAVIALVVFVTHSENIAILAIVVVPTGMLEQIAQFVLANALPDFAPLRDCLDGFLAAQVRALSTGAVPDGITAFLPALGTLLVIGAASVLVMRRRALK